jgi:hypothetical protein
MVCVWEGEAAAQMVELARGAPAAEKRKKELPIDGVRVSERRETEKTSGEWLGLS